MQAISRLKQRMPTLVSLFPPVPSDPIHAAGVVAGPSIYLTIGDQLERLLAGIELAQLDPTGAQPPATLAILALVTAFQFAEVLPDRQAAEATRTHADWKYALHLAHTHPGLNHHLLCEFRQTLFRDRSAQQIFQQVLDRLAEVPLWRGADRQAITASEVLAAVCRVSLLEQLIEAMHMVLEAVAAIAPESLRTITLPHWYERYSQLQAARDLPKSQEGQSAWARAIGTDATYLLEAVARLGDKLSSLPEIRSLQQVRACQFESADSAFRWHTPSCAACCLR